MSDILLYLQTTAHGNERELEEKSKRESLPYVNTWRTAATLTNGASPPLEFRALVDLLRFSLILRCINAVRRIVELAIQTFTCLLRLNCVILPATADGTVLVCLAYRRIM